MANVYATTRPRRSETRSFRQRGASATKRNAYEGENDSPENLQPRVTFDTERADFVLVFYIPAFGELTELTYLITSRRCSLNKIARVAVRSSLNLVYENRRNSFFTAMVRAAGAIRNTLSPMAAYVAEIAGHETDDAPFYDMRSGAKVIFDE